MNLIISGILFIFMRGVLLSLVLKSGKCQARERRITCFWGLITENLEDATLSYMIFNFSSAQK